MSRTITNASSSAEQVLHRFGYRNSEGGAEPNSPLINVNGIFYGTTEYGGPCPPHQKNVCGYGTVFGINATGAKKVLYQFQGGASDGARPAGGLIEFNGALYGTTYEGGGSGCSGLGCGTVYSISPSGSEKVLYRFRGGSDGASPSGALVAVNGTLYGTTSAGGVVKGCSGSGCGSVYDITTSGSEQVLYRFGGSSSIAGWLPIGHLIDVNGALYGVTSVGGVQCDGYSFGCGTAYKIRTSGAATSLYAFGSGQEFPDGSLVEVQGALYGTAGGETQSGTVYKLNMHGAYTMLYHFHGGQDGSTPIGGLIYAKGLLYGVTESGGVGCATNGCGTIFSITTTGSKTTIYSFPGEPNGANPVAALLFSKDKLYGTTKAGGNSQCGDGCGTAFEVSP